jgi:hypothetical protein
LLLAKIKEILAAACQNKNRAATVIEERSSRSSSIEERREQYK